MESGNQILLSFLGVDFPSVNFSSQKATVGKNTKIEINIEPKYFCPKDSPDSYTIIMNVLLKSEEYFELNVTALGYFKLSGSEEITDETRKSFINVNSVAIMFPYIRSFISTFTSNLGKVIDTVTIPTRFFRGELKELEFTEDLEAQKTNSD
jgi:preprotein translocase subunit SecB